MLNQDRVRQMSRLAMMETQEGQEALFICSSRRPDYIILQIVKGIVAGTICFGILLVLWVFLMWDDLNAYFADAQYEAFLFDTLKGYAVFMAVYLLMCGVLAAVRYKRARVIRTKYMKGLNALNKSYKAEKMREKAGSATSGTHEKSGDGARRRTQ